MDEELLAKLTTTLASDVDLYNEVINGYQKHETDLKSVQDELTETSEKLEESKLRGDTYLAQISNLLSKIPVGNTEQVKSYDQKVEEIKKQSWTK